MDWSHPLVQGAVIALIASLVAAGAGVGGAIFGARIAAGAARHAADTAQKEAQANREEAREARFADRIRELAAQLLDSGTKFDAGIASYYDWLQTRRGTPPRLNLGETFPQVLRELQLVCRREETLAALSEVEYAVGTLDAYVPDLPRGIHPDVDADLLGAFNQTRSEYARAAARFTEAVRIELGAPARRQT